MYFLYPIVLATWVALSGRRSAEDKEEEYLPFVSIIIAAYNEERYIENKIKNCLSIDYPKEKMEIIIGSDGSSDRTNEIAEKYVAGNLRFLRYSKRRGKMAVVNDCVRAARGEICVFSDVSELFDQDAVRNLIRMFLDSTVGGVTGNHIYNVQETGLGKGTRLYWRYQRWLQGMESRAATILSCDGTIYACRRELFPFPPPGTINDDKAVPMGIVSKGYRIVFQPQAIARGDVLPETRAFFRQKVRGQAGMYQVFWLFRGMFWPTHPRVWLVFMSHAVGPVIVPWLLILLLFSNLVLHAVPPYGFILVLQLAFYLTAVIGFLGQQWGVHVPLLHIPYFFTVSNAASIAGFWSYLLKVQRGAWTKVE